MEKQYDLIIIGSGPAGLAAALKAKEAGCRAAVGGIGMLLWQGAAAFELFTGKEMPAQEVMERFFQ